MGEAIMAREWDTFELLLRLGHAARKLIEETVEEEVEKEVERRVERYVRRYVLPLIAGIQGQLTTLGVHVSDLTDAVADMQGAVGETVTKLDQLADQVEALETGAGEANQAAADIRGVATALR
ncbi:MAG TPA: hypothetical protein VFG33_35720, partial [Kribbella sp.]|uniref:hypothetical protein n=1 Tax=Kribbella sp. TaxID=1871183 RepID=UPI002D799C88